MVRTRPPRFPQFVDESAKVSAGTSQVQIPGGPKSDRIAITEDGHGQEEGCQTRVGLSTGEEAGWKASRGSVDSGPTTEEEVTLRARTKKPDIAVRPCDWDPCSRLAEARNSRWCCRRLRT